MVPGWIYLPMVSGRVVVAFAPEQRTFATRTCAVLIGSRDEACVTERLAVDVVVIIAVLVRDASVRSPNNAWVIARRRVLSYYNT